MRWTIAAALAGVVLLATGCQDNEARQQIQQLKDENAKLKTDPVQQLLAAKLADGGGSEATDRKLNALAEDLRAGVSDLKKELANNSSDQKKRVDDLDDRLKKVANLESTITALKAAIDTLEGKVKGSNPEEVLKLQKELLQAQAALDNEKRARETAEGKLTQAQADLKIAQDAAKALDDQVKNLENSDLAKRYKTATDKVRELEGRVQKAEDDVKTLDEQKRRLEDENQRLRGGDKPKVEGPGIDPKKFDFTGSVVSASTGTKPGAASLLIIKVETGQLPPIGAELDVRDARGASVCFAKVVQHYHPENDLARPVDEIGCSTIDEKPTRPVAKGDTLVWVKPVNDKSAKPEDKDKTGAAGGN